jgi:hypothetical protein
MILKVIKSLSQDQRKTQPVTVETNINTANSEIIHIYGHETSAELLRLFSSFQYSAIAWFLFAGQYQGEGYCKETEIFHSK